MRCSQYMKFKNITFYIQYLCIRLLISIICIIMYKYCQIVPNCSNLAQFVEMPKERDLLYVIHDPPPFYFRVFVFFCSRLPSIQTESSYIPAYFSTLYKRDSVMKGFFKGQKSLLLKTVCSVKCIHKTCHSLSCVLWVMHSNRWS